MKKCDFCSRQDPNSVCQGFVGADYCEEAAKAFKEYMLVCARSNAKDKTININKNSR